MTDPIIQPPGWTDPDAILRNYTQRLFGKTTEQPPLTDAEQAERTFARNLFGKDSDNPADWAAAAAERHWLPAEAAGALRGTTKAEIDAHAAVLAKHRPYQPKDETGSFLQNLFGNRPS